MDLNISILIIFTFLFENCDFKSLNHVHDKVEPSARSDTTLSDNGKTKCQRIRFSKGIPAASKYGIHPSVMKKFTPEHYAERESKAYLPFSLSGIDRNDPVKFVIHLESDVDQDDISDALNYQIEISPQRLRISEVDTNGRTIAILAEEPFNYLPFPFQRDSGRGYFVKARNKRNSKGEKTDSSIALYEGGQASSALLSYEFGKDDEKPAFFSRFGFSVYSETGEKIETENEVEIRHSCSSLIGGKCWHKSECVAYGSRCVSWGDDSYCDCEVDMLPKIEKAETGLNVTTCVASTASIGSACSSTRECLVVNGRCRDGICKCFDHQDISHEDGSCIDGAKDGLMNWYRFKPTPAMVKEMAWPGKPKNSKHRVSVNLIE